MFEFGKVNYYDGDILCLRNVAKNVNFHEIDEAVFICDLTELERKHATWQKHLPRVKPYYAVKCNDDPRIVQKMVKLGVNFDCASKVEIQQVLEANGTSDQIIFANPCKPVSHLKFAKEQKVMASTVDNEFEIYKIYKHYPESDIILRFRSEAKEAQCPLGDKFGCNAEEDVNSLIMLAKSLQLNVIGVSFHVGSGCKDFPAYDRAIKTAKNIFEFGELLGYNMTILDIGGGFPGNDDEKFAQIADIVNNSLEKNFPDETVQVIAEPGRFFVAAAMTLICKIHAKREVHEHGKLSVNCYYLNDGVYGSFNCILYDHQVVTPVHLLDENEENLPKFKTLIWGPTCDALDKITEDVYLPNLYSGDLIAFPNMGAYTMPVASPFNGFLIPKVLYFESKLN